MTAAAPPPPPFLTIDQADQHLRALRVAHRYAEAEAGARQMIQQWPNHGASWKALSAALAATQRNAEALPVLERTRALLPADPEVHNTLGNVLWALNRFSESEASYRRALDLAPELCEAHNNLANALQGLGRLSEAEASYRRALELKPHLVQIHSNLGVALQGLGRLSEAEACYRRALERNPDDYNTLVNLGNVLKDFGRFIEAEAVCRRAVRLDPGREQAHVNLGNALQGLGRFAEAEASYRRALEIRPGFAAVQSNLIFTLNYLPGATAATLLAEARNYGKIVAAQARRFSAWLVTPDRSRRLRVGLVSGDLREHPAIYFLESFLAQSSAEQFELYAYQTHAKTDAYTERVRPFFAAWKSAVGMNDEQLARSIHADAIDILIDFSGHSGHNRLAVFAWKPAPVQLNWLGNLTTTGVAEMDYLLGDPYLTPPEDAAHFSETVWRLPETMLCFTPPQVPLAVAPLPALSNGFVTFGSLNNLTKMNDAVVALWSRVLHAVPRSRLLLKTSQLVDAAVREDTLRRFASFGVASDRFILETSSARVEMLKTYDRVDIALDPFPHPGVTTSVEALWMGVPVLTRRGERFLSRSGGAFAHHAGLSDWIAADDDDYVRRAASQTADLHRLARLRAELRAQLLASPLCDAPRFARHFEEAMRDMWRKWCDQR